MSDWDPLLHGPAAAGPHTLPAADSTGSRAFAGPPVIDREQSAPAEDFLDLHFAPWKIIDSIRAVEPGKNFMLKILVGLFGLTWFGAFLSWNIDGRSTTLGLLERMPPVVWEFLQRQAGGVDVLGVVYQIVFAFKQMSLFMAPFWTFVPSLTWAGLAAAGLFILGKYERDAFAKLLCVALLSQWFQIWRAVPVTGGAMVTLAQFLFGLYAIKRLFGVSFKTALVVVYLVPMLVVGALLFTLTAVLAAV